MLFEGLGKMEQNPRIQCDTNWVGVQKRELDTLEAVHEIGETHQTEIDEEYRIASKERVRKALYRLQQLELISVRFDGTRKLVRISSKGIKKLEREDRIEDWNTTMAVAND